MTNEEIYENVMGHKPNKEFGVKGSFGWEDIEALMNAAVKNCSIPVVSGSLPTSEELQDIVVKIAYSQQGEEQSDDCYAKMGMLHEFMSKYVQKQLHLYVINTGAFIKPLEWIGKIKKDNIFLHAQTPFGQYAINKYKNNQLTWGYCFDEYLDEEEFEIDSIENAKKAAWEHWVERIEPILRING